MNVIDLIQKEQEKPSVPDFRPGDYGQGLLEGRRRRQRAHSDVRGVVTVRQGGSSAESITVRRVAHGIGVEKVVLAAQPRVDRIEVSKRGIVRRSRLYYLSDKIGKAARIKEKKVAK